MHLYVVAKGHYDSLSRWQHDLLAQFLPSYKDGKPVFLGVNKDGIPIKEFLRLSVRPVQLFEIGFHKENLDTVLSMVCPAAYLSEKYPILAMTAKILRKILKLQEVPFPTTQNPFLQPNPVDKAVAVMPIGLKEDAVVDGKEDI